MPDHPQDFISALSHFPPVQGQPCFANGSCSEKNGADGAVRWAFARASSWRTPPHWSRCDWLDELQAIIQHGAACASLNYDPGRGVPLAAHIYLRAVGAARTRYRQEWSYYLHCINELPSSVEPIATSFDQASNQKELNQLLGKALNRLSVEDQWLIHQLFWDKADQCRVATRLQITQQCVSRRKARILRQLRRVFHKQS